MSDVINRAVQAYWGVGKPIRQAEREGMQAAIRVVLEDMHRAAPKVAYISIYAGHLGIKLTKPEEADNGR